MKEEEEEEEGEEVRVVVRERKSGDVADEMQDSLIDESSQPTLHLPEQCLCLLSATQE